MLISSELVVSTYVIRDYYVCGMLAAVCNPAKNSDEGGVERPETSKRENSRKIT